MPPNTAHLCKAQDGKTLVSGSADETMHLCKAQDGKTLVSGSADETIKIWPVSLKKSLPKSNVAKAKPEIIPQEVQEIAKLDRVESKAVSANQSKLARNSQMV